MGCGSIAKKYGTNKTEAQIYEKCFRRGIIDTVATLDIDSGTPLDADVFSRMCASRGVLQHVVGRWASLIVVALRENTDPLRFAAIRRRVDGISDRMLSQTLGQLEREGVVRRRVHSTIPPHVDYGLTDLGYKLAEPLSDLIDIIQAELPHVLEAQKAFDEADGSQPGGPSEAND